MNIIEIINKKQKRTGYIKSLCIDREISLDDIRKFDLYLKLVSYPDLDDEELDIIFKEISDLKIDSIDNMLKICLNIDDVSAFQMEDINYKVCEIENGLFSFTCKNIIING